MATFSLRLASSFAQGPTVVMPSPSFSHSYCLVGPDTQHWPAQYFLKTLFFISVFNPQNKRGSIIAIQSPPSDPGKYTAQDMAF